ncbi:uncharacterized protein LOC110188239 [Drosophila serrata]|uniref:uncharacterized protein LOC110188239 n=1 Tax=Drosophila serrata TaxID=7274 RepID=UPI000A1D1BDA|nr:uncharacterized protein LOC110188239 [Drosophila serrata]
MFLNDLGQPLILEAGKKYGPFEQHRGALVLSSAAFKDHVVPEEWSKLVLGSEADLCFLQLQNVFKNAHFTNCTLKTLSPNKPTQIEHGGTKITITLIPAGKSEDDFINLYYIENGYTRTLIVDRLSGYLDFLPKANLYFHQGLSQGIDVMYVDEGLLDGTQLNENLYALAHLIRPKHIYGLRQKELPKWLLDLRRQKCPF